MNELFAYLLSEIWNHRRNRFIAVGGTAVFFFFLMLLLNSIPSAPDWLSEADAVMLGLSVLATLAMMGYYTVKFLVWATRHLWVAFRHQANGDVARNSQHQSVPK